MKARQRPQTGGDQLVGMLSALANPQRLRIIAARTSGRRNYVSQLAMIDETELRE